MRSRRVPSRVPSPLTTNYLSQKRFDPRSPWGPSQLGRERRPRPNYFRGTFSPSSSPQTYAQNAGRGSSPFPRDITIPRGSSVTGLTATATAHLQKKCGSPERSRTLSSALRATRAFRHPECQTPTDAWASYKSLCCNYLCVTYRRELSVSSGREVSIRHALRRHAVSIRYATFIARTVSAWPCCRSTDTCQPS